MRKSIDRNKPYRLPVEIERKVKAALVSKGKSFRSIAENKDYTEQAVCRVFKGWRRGRRIRRDIARAAGMRMDEIWTD